MRSLGIRYLFRQEKALGGDNDDVEEDRREDEGNWEGDHDARDDNGKEGEEGDEDVWNVGDGDFHAYTYPFSKFPLLRRRHLHPFPVIINACSKLGVPWDAPDDETRNIHALLRRIMNAWGE
jgi:hypothetical protein